MRVFLLPISTRRTLLYAHRLQNAGKQQEQAWMRWMDKVQTKAAETWAGWEQKESGWQSTVVKYGNQALRRVPYEEWGLKSMPPLSSGREDDSTKGMDKVQVIYPQTLIPPTRVTEMLLKLSTERESLHRQRLIYCLIGMPISAPFAAVPIVPNIPFFYLTYRAWSHWRALEGGKHLQFLLKNQLLIDQPSSILEEVYAKQSLPLPSTPDSTANPGEPKNTHPNMPQDAQPTREVMLLDQTSGKKLTHALGLPQLEVELERAIWQVEQAIEKQNAERDAKKDDPGSQ